MFPLPAVSTSGVFWMRLNTMQDRGGSAHEPGRTPHRQCPRSPIAHVRPLGLMHQLREGKDAAP